jgi:tetratricopeptide (TPR) repeat protein
MKNLTLFLLCAGLITTTAIAEENCLVFYEAQNYEKSAQCFVKKLKKDRSFDNLISAGISYCELDRYKEALLYLKEAEKKHLLLPIIKMSTVG